MVALGVEPARGAARYSGFVLVRAYPPDSRRSFTPQRRRLGPLRVAALLTASCLTDCSRRAPAEQEPLKVAAAADLSFAFQELGAAYEKKTGRRVMFSFGSTGLLEKQIAEGAPFDVFAAANVSFVDDAVQSGACLKESKALYAVGRLVLMPARAQRDGFVARNLSDLPDPRMKRLAIANPMHAPYGRAARQALERAGVWDAVAAKLVYGENVQQALQFVETGNADAAIVALSLAIVSSRDWTPIPAELHDQLDQALVLCAHGKAGVDAGRGFASYLSSSEGRSVMRKYGFLLPAESAGATARNPKP